jgi:hypothetical protein
MASVVDIRVRNSKKSEGDLNSRIHTIVFPEESEILFDQVQEQMMMDGYANRRWSQFPFVPLNPLDILWREDPGRAEG